MGHKFTWVDSMRAWACAECGKVKRVARGKSDGGICRAKEVSQAGADRLKSGDGMHKSHCIWKGWGKEGHPPTNVCVRCGCFSTFRCVNLRTICKGGFASEAARRRVGLGKHPTSGQTLKKWSKVGDGTEGVQEGSPSEHSLHEEVRGKADDGAGWDRIPSGGSRDKGREEGLDEDPEDWGLWMDGGQEEEDPYGGGFLGFDDP